MAAYGLPDLPEPGHDYLQNVELCTRSFLDVAWDDAAEGWHHTLSDPWGARYEAEVANALWRYGRRPGGDPVLRTRARDQVRRGVARAQANAAPDQPRPAPHMDLALVFGQVEGALDAAAALCRQAVAEQAADGSWPWQPASVQGGELKTADRLAIMGKEGDSATGYSGSRVQPVLKYALYTGDASAVAAARRCADWCNAQRRPEGAQAWELHLHVPDVLAVPHLINLNLGVARLTGDDGYLAEAERWAWTGLPFTYLWNGYYRPVMRYGTIPVFGVTFHDVQPWFGVIVQWNGLVYAEALLRLVAQLERTPVEGRPGHAGQSVDWRHLAEGIVRHAMQEQMGSGPYLGMYPDAYSPVKGDEEYTWWLNPRLVAATTFPLAGLPVTPEPRVLRWDHRPRIHVTSGAVVETAEPHDGQLRLTLRDQPGATSFTLIAGAGKPRAVQCEGMNLAEAAGVEEAAQGWQWLPEHGAALIQIQPATEIATLQCELA
jgi:hypothetical protein